MEGLNTVIHFWVPLKLHPPPGTAEPPNWAENPGGAQPLLSAAASPSHVVDITVDIMADFAVDIVVGLMVDIMVGIAAGIILDILVGIVVGFTEGIAAGSVSQMCKASPARAMRNRFRSAKLY
ncbi:hypothetical protein llap_13066 [Limosa lapponica baueri]|uniref:Uncharacterized protein n=1 Tax=Limosa lapponica baueri TaxID=1758121 RepID=A0A2I0TS74_LIMLA|nr:hypothetical protein llap_13066 [Limosa lapponica baueri]